MPNGSARRERTRHSAVLDGGEDSFVFLKRQQHETLETGSTLDVLGDLAPLSSCLVKCQSWGLRGQVKRMWHPEAWRRC